MIVLSIEALHALPSPGMLDIGRQSIRASDVESMQLVPEGVTYRLGSRRILVPWTSIRYLEVADAPSPTTVARAGGTTVAELPVGAVGIPLPKLQATIDAFVDAMEPDSPTPPPTQKRRRKA